MILKLLKRVGKIQVIIFILLVLLIFHNWFNNQVITAGDFWPLYKEQYAFYSLWPFAWSNLVGHGLGGNAFYTFWNYILFSYPIIFLGKYLQLPYPIVERLGFIFPLLLLAIFSSYIWAKAFFKSNIWAILLSMAMYMFNTYALMIISGGQMGIDFAYFLSPIVFLSFIKLFSNKFETIPIKDTVISALLLALLISFDLRVAYIIMIGIFLYWCIYHLYLLQQRQHRKMRQEFFYSILSYFVIPISIAILLHSYWIFPILIAQTNPVEQVGKAYSTTAAVNFLSFAKFENTFSLLHPNWPENIFGKIYFMRAEFLVLPIIAFMSLLFINLRKEKSHFLILFLVCNALVGIFLAKGSNPPFGDVYLWLFTHFPGFVMFRDASKFYLLIALSYAILIPWTISYVIKILRIESQRTTTIIWGIIVFCYILLIFPRTIVNTKGIFQTTSIPQEYTQLKNFLSKDRDFYRTMWIPHLQRFGYYSPTHPAISAGLIFDKTNSEDIVTILQGKNKSVKTPQRLLQNWGVIYVVLPYDSESELFLRDRKYNTTERLKLEKQLDSISWLRKIPDFHNITVYKVEGAKSHFYFQNSKTFANKISYRMIDPTHYQITTALSGPATIVFSESFDPRWKAIKDNVKISSIQTPDKLNSFQITEGGVYTIEYTPQISVNYFFIFSLLSLSVLLLSVIFWTRKR